MNGEDLITKFRISVEAVVPAFTDNEILEFLNQAQLAVCLKLIPNDIVNKLYKKRIFDNNPSTNYDRFDDSLIFGNYTKTFTFNLDDLILKFTGGRCIITYNNGNDNMVLPIEIVNSIFINKFISYPNNKVYLDKPVLFITSINELNLNTDKSKNLIIITPNEEDLNIDNSTGIVYKFEIDYYRVPSIITKTTNVEFEELASDIVETAKQIALNSIYIGGQNMRQTEQQTQQQVQ